MAAALTSFGLPVPDDVVIWFGWHDGTDATSLGEYSQRPENVLLGNWFLLSLDQAVAVRRSTWELYREIEWHMVEEIQSWFPVLAWSGAALLCVDCDDGGGSGEPAPVHLLDPQGDDYSGSPAYQSLAQFRGRGDQPLRHGDDTTRPAAPRRGRRRAHPGPGLLVAGPLLGFDRSGLRPEDLAQHPAGALGTDVARVVIRPPARSERA